MNNNKTKGRLGEYLATKHLQANGYTIKGRRFGGRYGEIDIIAEKDGVTVFIEVKARSGTGYGWPSEAVTPVKQRKIIKTAELYIQQNELQDKPVRLDVIEVYLNEKRVNHIIDAF